MGSQDPKGRFSYKSAGFRCGSKSLVSTTPSMQRERLELARIEAVLQVQQRFADKENELRLQELELAKKVEAMKIQREGKFSSVDVDKSSMDLSENPEDKQGLMDEFLEPPRCPISVQSNDEFVMSLSDIEKTTVMSWENGKELNDTQKVVNKPLSEKFWRCLVK